MQVFPSISTRRKERTRSVSPENITGKKGMGGRIPPEEGTASFASKDLGLGWKTNPYYYIDPQQTITLCDIEGPGEIRHIWLTPTGNWRKQILRIYWDGETTPAVECPLGDFFCCGWGEYAPLSSLAVCVNPGSAFNCYWTMPFRTHCLMTLENVGQERVSVYYQIDYAECDIAPDALYFHAQFRRENPLPYKVPFTVLDGIEGAGHYAGIYLLWGSNSNGWWGEGEIKFFMDGDTDFPTLCGTGTEDYFCGSYNFENKKTQQYETYTTPYAGLSQVIKPDGLYRSQMRFSMYRWHLTDPVVFEQDLLVTMQALGWRHGAGYLPLQDDIACVAYFYLDKPSCKLPALPDVAALEIN